MTETNWAARQHVMEQLEMAIDSSGLPLVLELMAEVCSEKAEHLRHAWQDEAIAKDWDVAAGYLLKMAWHKATVRTMPCPTVGERGAW